MFILINNTAVPVLNIIDVRLLPAKRGYCRLPLRRVDSLKDVVTPEQEMWIRDHVGRGHNSDEEMYLGARIHHNGETENTYEALLRFKFNNLFGCI